MIKLGWFDESVFKAFRNVKFAHDHTTPFIRVSPSFYITAKQIFLNILLTILWGFKKSDKNTNFVNNYKFCTFQCYELFPINEWEMS